MQYRDKNPVTKPARAAGRGTQRRALNERQEEHRRKHATGGGQEANELGITQGQNGEQGNTTEPRNTAPLAQPGSE